MATSGSAVPSVNGPDLPDEATHGDDGVGEVEDGVNGGAAVIAVLQPVEGSR